jgi:hypothetical protein
MTNDWPPGLITTDSWAKAVERNLIKPLNIRVTEFPEEALKFITDHYNKKNTYYINIEGKGLFYMGKNPAKLPVPSLAKAGKMTIEFRPGRSGSKNDRCGAGFREQGRILDTDNSINSPHSLDSVAAVKKLHAST